MIVTSATGDNASHSYFGTGRGKGIYDCNSYGQMTCEMCGLRFCDGCDDCCLCEICCGSSPSKGVAFRKKCDRWLCEPCPAMAARGSGYVGHYKGMVLCEFCNYERCWYCRSSCDVYDRALRSGCNVRRWCGRHGWHCHRCGQTLCEMCDGSKVCDGFAKSALAAALAHACYQVRKASAWYLVKNVPNDFQRLHERIVG